MARTEFYSERNYSTSDTESRYRLYGFAEADTTYGKVGVKAWIYKGEVLPGKRRKEG